MTIERGIRRTLVVLSGLCFIVGIGYADPNPDSEYRSYRFIYTVIAGTGERINLDVESRLSVQALQGRLVLEGRPGDLIDGEGKVFSLADCKGDRTTICVEPVPVVYEPLANKARRWLGCIAFGGALVGVLWLTFYILLWVVRGFGEVAR